MQADKLAEKMEWLWQEWQKEKKKKKNCRRYQFFLERANRVLSLNFAKTYEENKRLQQAIAYIQKIQKECSDPT